MTEDFRYNLMKINCTFAKDKTAIIYVTSGDTAFPAEDWTDFYREIIADWVAVLNENSKVSISSFELYFMDGPYRLFCEKEGDTLNISGVDGHDESTVFSETSSFDKLFEQIKEISKNSRLE